MAPGTGRDFNCSWEHCGKSFNRKSDLCRHYRIHTNERPYNCDVEGCNKSFIQRSALTVHSRTHTGEKPHVCDQEGCQKAFSDSSSLARHRRIHTGKRPYICQEPSCERSFCRKTTLTKHQHRSHPPGSQSRPSSEETASPHSYTHHPPGTLSMPPNEQYMLAQQPYYPQATPTPAHEFYSPPQSVPMNSVPMHDNAPIVTQNIPASSPMSISPHAPPPPQQQHPQPSHPQPHPQHQQQYLHMMQQQQHQHQQQQERYDPTPRTAYLPPEYQHSTFPAHHHMPEGQSMMVSYHPNFQLRDFS